MTFIVRSFSAHLSICAENSSVAFDILVFIVYSDSFIINVETGITAKLKRN